jgi:hypothetical protein
MPLGSSVAVGAVSGAALAAYIAVFYAVASKVVPLWLAPQSGYSDMFAAKVPAFELGVFSLDAAVYEEAVYRVLIPAFVARVSGKVWVGILTGAFLWGFAHSAYAVYPVYLRGIELTLGGIALSLFYRRFGFVAAVVAHYVADCLLAGLPFVFSGDRSLFVGFAAALVSAYGVAWLIEKADAAPAIGLHSPLAQEKGGAC